MKHKFLVTGASGFVGSWIVRSLIEKGEDVSILVRNKKKAWRISDIADKLAIYEVDLLSPQLEKNVDKIKPSVVFHLASYGALPGQTVTLEDLIDTNVKGVANLINAVKKHNIQLFINTGSSSEYGIKNNPMQESDLLEPVNLYGVSKSAATLFCQQIAKKENLPLITFRLFSPYGAYDDSKRLIPYVITRAIKNEPLLLSSKDNVRDFVYIKDVVLAYLAALNKSINPGEIINLGSGKQHTVYDIVKQIISVTGSRSKLSWGSMPKQSRQIEPKLWLADITKAKEILHWQPTYSLENGLKETIKYYE